MPQRRPERQHGVRPQQEHAQTKLVADVETVHDISQQTRHPRLSTVVEMHNERQKSGSGKMSTGRHNWSKADERITVGETDE
jgi:hypothetical protein